MINIKYFFKGFKSIKGAGSPAIALAASFVAIGALLKSLGFTVEESIFSTLLTYALPGSLVMAESMLIGASLILLDGRKSIKSLICSIASKSFS